jgi:hypothetical protein
MIKKEIVILEKSGKKHELTVQESENPVTIEYAINCGTNNYSDAVMKEITRLNINPNNVLSVQYLDDNIEKYEHGQGKEISNRI